MKTKKWGDLPPRVRKTLLVAGSIEGLLKVAALVDLKRRPAEKVRGSKRAWGLAITFVNSFGAVPLAYFARGRR
ncbi:MAG TPA: hypothetical protein VFX52_13450 [Nocardioidaceae bacterium]|jgi:hypothetical protein|nr:hypothetical protein [Nocardioidaceae bacterium]